MKLLDFCTLSPINPKVSMFSVCTLGTLGVFEAFGLLDRGGGGG